MPVGTVSPSTFEWIIPSGFLCMGAWISSPDFHMMGSRWYMQLNYAGWIEIYLSRRDSGLPKTITYTIKVDVRSDVQEITKTSHFEQRETYFGGRIFLKKVLASDTDLLITFYVKCNTLRPVSGNQFVSCEVQTEVENSVIEKENSKDEDRSSLDMKGNQFASCAVQTNIPDCVSCAIQTEVENSLIEKENPNDEDRPSLDMKDDALLRERMKELLTKGKDHDVTICVRDKEFRAHRSILSTRSPVFAMMLSHDTKENNTGNISIEDCDPESLDEFLLYVYSGRTENLTPSNALQLYYPADKYDFPVLKERCVSLLKTSLSIESICDVVLLAARHREKELLEVATEFFARNMKQIVVTVGWQKFMPQNPVEANELIVKSMEILHPEN